MAVSIVIGGQYGSEGKGKVAYYWAKKIKATAVVRVGGSNSGHTVYDENGKKYVFRMLPSASILGEVVSILPAGSYIDVPVLLQEIEMVGVSYENLKIDPNAIIIREEHRKQEAELKLEEKIGSTMSGTGAAVMERIKRDKISPIIMAKDIVELQPFLTDTKKYMRQLIDDDKDIVIEGTQGYGLSNYHSKSYPYATSRDTTAAGFLSETGLSPLDVNHIVMVIRAFPIRVAGVSGPLENEIDWETVSRESGANIYFEEVTTVTHKIRRVARFTPEIVREAILVNKPDVIVMNHLDYLDYENREKNLLSKKQRAFLETVEKQIGRKVDYYGNGMSNLF